MQRLAQSKYSINDGIRSWACRAANTPEAPGTRTQVHVSGQKPPVEKRRGSLTPYYHPMSESPCNKGVRGSPVLKWHVTMRKNIAFSSLGLPKFSFISVQNHGT